MFHGFYYGKNTRKSWTGRNDYPTSNRKFTKMKRSIS